MNECKTLFNCHNGTLDLQTMKFYEHAPNGRFSPADYNPRARYENFLAGKEAADYFQRAVGYSLTGDASLDCFFFVVGPANPTKAILKVMGDYGRVVSPGTLIAAERNARKPSGDIARMAGVRFITVYGLNRRDILNCTLMRTLTGGNTIVARFPYKNSFEFEMQGKIFIDTDCLPDTLDADLFASGRVKVIPLMGSGTLEGSPSGILNWCIEGYKKFKERGLEEPAEITAATEQYAVKADKVIRFCRERGAEMKPGDIFHSYKDWCADNGFAFEGYSDFHHKLELYKEMFKS